MSIPTDNPFRTPQGHVVVHAADVPATLRILARYGVRASAYPSGAYEGFEGQHTVTPLGTREAQLVGLALARINAGGPGAISCVEALGVDLDQVEVQRRASALSARVVTTLYVHGEQVWPAVAEGVAA